MWNSLLRLVLISMVFSTDIALSAALTNAQTYGAQHPDAFRNGTPGMMMVKGIGDNNSYMLEADPTTGRLPVDANVTFGYDTNYGAVGADTLRTAAQIGNATGAAAFGAGTTSAQTLRVVLPTDQTSIPVTFTPSGSSYADSVAYSYAGGSVTTGAWTQVIASTAAAINTLCITDTSGQIMQLGVGGAGVESVVFLIAQGWSGCIGLHVAASSRIAVKAVTATASTGYLTLSGLQ